MALGSPFFSFDYAAAFFALRCFRLSQKARKQTRTTRPGRPSGDRTAKPAAPSGRIFFPSLRLPLLTHSAIISL